MFNRNKKVSEKLPGEGQPAIQGSSTDLILKELAIDYMKDKRIRRRWKVAIFSIVGFYFLMLLFFQLFGYNSAVDGHQGQPHIAVVELSGVISANQMGASAEHVNAGLRKAFAVKQAKAVFLKINSPGGSPVQSAEINTEMTLLRQRYPDKPLYVIMSDMAASGGYYVAVAAEKIYANPSSIVGSIGVRMDSFGFVDAIKKYGIERRSITAGNNKAILDPFLPVKASHKKHAENMLAQVHQQFIKVVKQGRGDKLKDNAEIFSGLFWTGEKALELGLIDGFGSVDSVAEEEFNLTETVNYTYQPTFWEEFGREFGASVGEGIGKILLYQTQTPTIQ